MIELLPSIQNLAVFEIAYVPCPLQSLSQWVTNVASLISYLTQNGTHFQLNIIWLPCNKLTTRQTSMFITTMQNTLSSTWNMVHKHVNGMHHNDALDSARDVYVISIIDNVNQDFLPPRHLDQPSLIFRLLHHPYPANPNTTTFTLPHLHQPHLSTPKMKFPLVITQLYLSNNIISTSPNN